MRKIIIGIVIAFFTTLYTYASDWQFTLGYGLSLPYSRIHAKNGLMDNIALDPIDTWQFESDNILTFLLVNNSCGISFKSDLTGGYALTDDEGIRKGGNIGADFGVGYSFARSERFTMGLFAMFGFDYSLYNYKTDLNIEGIRQTFRLDIKQNIFSYSIGADLTGAFRFTKHFGIFGSLGGRSIIGGKVKGTASIEKDPSNLSWDLNGKFIFVPTMGISWTF